MSAVNTLDQNRVDAMILAALVQDEKLLPRLREMADRYSEPADVLARFLVSGGKDAPDFGDEDETIPCEFKQWEYFMGRCRKATASARIQTREQLDLYAAIGRWPQWLPSFTAHYTEQFAEFFSLDFVTAWAWTWLKNPKDLEWILGGHTPFWYPASRDHGWVVAAGLCYLIEKKLIEVPEEKQVKFVLAYTKWYANVSIGNASVGHLAYILGMQDRIGTFSNSELQALATCWDWAAGELANRFVPLAIPAVQITHQWITQLSYFVSNSGGIFEQDVEVWQHTTNSFVRYMLSRRWANRYVSNPEDPFGHEVNEFLWKVGAKDWPVFPSYEDAEAYLNSMASNL